MKQDDLDQAKQDLMDRFWMTGWIRQAVSPVVERDELEDDAAEEEHVESRRRDGATCPYCFGAGEVPASSTCYIPCPQCQGKSTTSIENA